MAPNEVEKTSFPILLKGTSQLFKGIKTATVQGENGSQFRPVTNPWEDIVHTGYLIGMNKFKAILVLTETKNENFHFEAASLTRDLFELATRLKWMNCPDTKIRDERIADFQIASLQEQVTFDREEIEISGQILSEPQKQRKEELTAIKSKKGKDNLKMPSCKDLLGQIDDPEWKKNANVFYSNFYRQLCVFTHFSGKTKVNFDYYNIQKPNPGIGCISLNIAGFSFWSIFEIWNSIFRVLDDDTKRKVFQNWSSALEEVKKLRASSGAKE